MRGNFSLFKSAPFLDLPLLRDEAAAGFLRPADIGAGFA